MSTATVDKKPEVKAEEEAPAPFVMPKVRIGQQVVWYRYGEKIDTAQTPAEIAFVIKSGNRSITRMKTTDGFPVESVPHIDDPRLKNANFRASGAWDFIEEEKQQRAFNDQIAARVAALEEALKKK